MKPLLISTIVSLCVVASAFAQQGISFVAQGRRFENATIESMDKNIVTIRHSNGVTTLHRGVVPRELFTAYQTAQEAATQPEDSFAISAKIMQMQESGALAHISIRQEVERTRKREVPGTMLDRNPRYVVEVYTDTVSTPLKEPVFIYGIPTHLVDGDTWSGIVYITRNYRYTTVSGAAKTVRAFATSRGLAEQLLK